MADAHGRAPQPAAALTFSGHQQIIHQTDPWQTDAEAACNAVGHCVVVWPWEYNDDGNTRVRARQVALPKR